MSWVEVIRGHRASIETQLAEICARGSSKIIHHIHTPHSGRELERSVIGSNQDVIAGLGLCEARLFHIDPFRIRVGTN